MLDTRTRLHAAMPAERRASSNEVSFSRCLPTPFVKKSCLGTNPITWRSDASPGRVETAHAGASGTHRSQLLRRCQEGHNRTLERPISYHLSGGVDHSRMNETGHETRDEEAHR